MYWTARLLDVTRVFEPKESVSSTSLKMWWVKLTAVYWTGRVDSDSVQLKLRALLAVARIGLIEVWWEFRDKLGYVFSSEHSLPLRNPKIIAFFISKRLLSELMKVRTFAPLSVLYHHLLLYLCGQFSESFSPSPIRSTSYPVSCCWDWSPWMQILKVLVMCFSFPYFFSMCPSCYSQNCEKLVDCYELCLLPLRSNWYTFVSLLQVTFKLGLGSAIITDDQIRGTLRVSSKSSSRERCSCVLSCRDLEHGQFDCSAHVFCLFIMLSFFWGGEEGLNTTILVWKECKNWGPLYVGPEGKRVQEDLK